MYYMATRAHPLDRAQLAELVIREMQMSFSCKLDGDGRTHGSRGGNGQTLQNKGFSSHIEEVKLSSTAGSYPVILLLKKPAESGVKILKRFCCPQPTVELKSRLRPSAHRQLVFLQNFVKSSLDRRFTKDLRFCGRLLQKIKVNTIAGEFEREGVNPIHFYANFLD